MEKQQQQTAPATCNLGGRCRIAEMQTRADPVYPSLYGELRKLAANCLRHERKGHTLQPTALFHEAFLKLVDQRRVDWRGQTHFLATAAQAMRRILVDHARRRQPLLGRRVLDSD